MATIPGKRVNPERRRALMLLARSRDGYTEPIMLAETRGNLRREPVKDQAG